MWHIYWHSSPIDAHNVIWACDIYVGFQVHISSWHIFCSLLIFDECMQDWVLYDYYSRKAVGLVCNMWQAYLFRGIYQ